MTKETRPNLGGLFTGTTPPERSSRISNARGPRPATPTPPTEPVGAAKPGTRIEPPGVPVPTVAGSRWPVGGWIDPVRAVERYFEVLQAVLDANRKFAVGLAGAVSSVSQRLLPHR